jgi:hypothetical protein
MVYTLITYSQGRCSVRSCARLDFYAGLLEDLRDGRQPGRNVIQDDFRQLCGALRYVAKLCLGCCQTSH